MISSSNSGGGSGLLSWFAPPELPSLELRQKARSLWIVSWPFLAVVVAMLALAVMANPATLSRRATTVAAVAIVVIMPHLISRNGRPELASWLLISGLTAVVTQRAWI